MRSFVGTYRFCDLVQLLAGGGTKILRMLLEELSAPMTFRDYMYQHQSKVVDLRLTEDQTKLITNREVEKMDITLLCILIKKLFKDKLTPRQIDLVNGIKAERDKLCHSDWLEKAQIDEIGFVRRHIDIKNMLLALSATMAAGVRQEMKTFIDKIENNKPDIDEISETLKEWYRSSPDTEQYIDRLDDALEQLRADYEEHKLLFDYDDLHLVVKASFEFEYKRYKRCFETSDPFDTELKDIALNHLQTSNIAVLQGQKGSGKTKGAFSLAHSLTVDKLIKTENCALIRNPSEMKAVNPEDLDLLIVDGIGNNRYMTPTWEESLRYLERLLGNSNMKVIITTRDAINLEFKTVNGTFKLASQTVKLQGLDNWPG